MSEPKNIRRWAKLLGEQGKRPTPRKLLGESWLIIIVFVVSMSICLFWQWKWHTLPCSSFQTNPVLRGGYAPARCINE